jgi:membrane protease YdiL (CAAX protease family)
MQEHEKNNRIRVSRHLPTVVGLFIALVLPTLIALIRGFLHRPLTDATRVILSLINSWIWVVILVMLVLFWEHLPLSSIAIRKMSVKDLGWSLLGFLTGVLMFAITTPLVKSLNLSPTGSGILRLAKMPIYLRVVVVFTAGITEEILFRGYPIERLNALTGRLWLGAAIAYVVFVLLHIPFWGIGGAIQIGFWSAIVTLLYVWRRNLPACMLMHVLNDAFAFIVLPMLFAQHLP